MENQSLINIVDEYFETNPSPYFAFDYGNQISLKKLKNVGKLYADFNSDIEAPLLLVDDTNFRSAKKGVLITTSNIFYRLYVKRGSYAVGTDQIVLNDVEEMRIDIHKGRGGSDLLVNGIQVGFMIAFGDTKLKKHEAETLNKLFELIIKSLHRDKELPQENE